MPTHITVNGQNYSSIQEMPPDIRRQYEAAMQFLSKNARALADGQTGDVNISTAPSDPAHHAFKTFTNMTSTRIMINGHEYSRWEDVPPEARAAFQSAFSSGHLPLASNVKIAERRQVEYNSSSTFTFSLTTLIFLIAIVLLIGICVGVGWKLLH